MKIDWKGISNYIEDIEAELRELRKIRDAATDLVAACKDPTRMNVIKEFDALDNALGPKVEPFVVGAEEVPSPQFNPDTPVEAIKGYWSNLDVLLRKPCTCDRHFPCEQKCREPELTMREVREYLSRVEKKFGLHFAQLRIHDDGSGGIYHSVTGERAIRIDEDSETKSIEALVRAELATCQP